MRKAMAVLMVMAMVMCLSAVGVAADDTHVGTWRLNVKKSDFGKNPPPKSGTLKVFVDTDKMLKWSYTEVAGDGKSSTMSSAAAVDGKPHPLAGNSGYKTAAFTRKGPGELDIAWTMKDGSTATEHSLV